MKKFLTWLSVIVVVVAGSYLILGGAAAARARTAADALKRAGCPTTIEEIESQFRTGSESTARVFEKAAAMLTKEDVATITRLDTLGWEKDPAGVTFLGDKRPVSELVAQASVMPPADFGMNPRDGYAAKIVPILQQLAAFKTLLRLQARELAAAGRPDSALGALATATRLSRLFAEPMFIYHLVAMLGTDSLAAAAARIAPAAGVPAIERLAAEFEKMDFKSEETRAVTAENVITCISARSGHVMDATVPLELAVATVKVLQPARSYVEARVREVVKEQLEYLPRPWYEGRKALAAIDSSNRRSDPLGRLAGIYVPNVSVFYARSERATVLRDLAVLGLAAIVEKKRTGRLPATLADFAPDAPVDRYSGEPYIYRVLPDGFVVYSVGPDEKDDGGTAPDDLVFRVGSRPGQPAPSGSRTFTKARG
jgi:hypothetical protein